MTTVRDLLVLIEEVIERHDDKPGLYKYSILTASSSIKGINLPAPTLTIQSQLVLLSAMPDLSPSTNCDNKLLKTS
jgi:hypothetical protein